MKNYLNLGRFGQKTPQNKPILGSSQAQNHAGGFSWAVDDITRLHRFLILGSQGGTYYVGEHTLTKENLDVVERMLKAGQGRAVVDAIVEVSLAGRAASNDPALFSLARCAACDVHGKITINRATEKTHALHRAHHVEFFDHHPVENTPWISKDGKKIFVRQGDTISITTRASAPGTVEVDHPDDIAIRQYALSVLPQVARTGTNLLHFVAYVKQFRGWGHGYRTAVASWFNNKQEQSLAYQILKYQQRDGYSQRDLLRLAHPKAETGTYNTLYHWAVKGWENVGEEPHPDPALQIIWAYEKAKRAQDAQEVALLIKEYKLPREAVPTQHLHSVEVWEALLEDMPLEAMMRNLATMTREGVIKPMSPTTALIASRLRDADRIQKARLHPIKILSALITYQSGKSVRGSSTWTPVQPIVDALNDAFYLSFEAVQPTNKRILLIVDTSGSMGYSSLNGIPGMSLHMAAGAMALVFAKTEPNCHIIGVDTSIQQLPISSRQRLDDAVRIVASHGGGGTNLALPMAYALQEKLEVDAFVVLTDSETWAGNGHPSQLLELYRQQINKEARIINIQMAATSITNNAPEDKRALDCVGFDTMTPQIISDFIACNL